MRWSAGSSLLLLAQACGSSASVPSSPIVYYWDPAPQSDKSSRIPSEAVEPETARLIFAQRLGLDQFHRLGDAGEDVLRQIGNYGGKQERLFGYGSGLQRKASTLVLVEGIREIPDDLDQLRHRDLRAWSNFTMTETPSETQNQALFSSFLSQLESLPAKDDTDAFESINKLFTVVSSPESPVCDEGHTEFKGTIGIGRFSACSQDISTKELLTKLYDRMTDLEVAMTLVMMPRRPTIPSKGASNPYGDISEPTKLFNRRETDATLTRKQTGGAAGNTRPRSAAATPSHYPFVPQCFSSASACSNGTASCSGHGECVKKFVPSKPGDDANAGDCFVCSCNKPEVLTNKDGTKKTTHFAGSACQKKDLSAPFWLLTLTAGSLLALVGFGVSMLYAMGNVELPSVIGAGVSGPRQK